MQSLERNVVEIHPLSAHAGHIWMFPALPHGQVCSSTLPQLSLGSFPLGIWNEAYCLSLASLLFFHLKSLRLPFSVSRPWLSSFVRIPELTSKQALNTIFALPSDRRSLWFTVNDHVTCHPILDAYPSCENLWPCLFYQRIRTGAPLSLTIVSSRLGTQPCTLSSCASNPPQQPRLVTLQALPSGHHWDRL